MKTVGLSIPPEHKMGPNCGVTAVSLMTGADFDRVWFIMNQRYGKNWKGRTYPSDWDFAFAALGFQLVALDTSWPCTVGGYVYYTKTTDLRMVEISGHVFVVQADLITDQYGTHKLNDCRFRNALVKGAYICLPFTNKGKPTSALDNFLSDI